MGIMMRGASALAIAMAATAWTPAAAQAQANAADSGQIADIVVTARRTSENLQTTPVAVTAATGLTLEKAQINTVDQLQTIAPGLIIQPAVAQPGSAAFALRGQSSPDGLIAVDQAVGAYVDGVYVARSSGSLFNFVDIERVEVLRGPQGTLFGRNTTGGAINVVTRRPTGELEGMARVRYGNYDAWEATGMINVPLHGDQLALRAVYQHSQRNGYGRNAAFDERVGGDNTDFVRGSLLIAPDGPWKVTLQGDYTNRKTGGEIVGLKSFTPTALNGLLVGLCSGPNALPACPYKGPAGDSLANYAVDSGGTGDFFRVFNSNPGIYGDAETWGASATVDIDLSDTIAFKSITAFRGLDTGSLSDNDGSPYVLTGGLSVADGNFVKQHQFSQEVQLSAQLFDDRLSLIVGGFYFDEKGTDRSKSYALFPLSPALAYVDASVANKSSAVYGQFTYKITDAIRFTGGLRYTEDKRGIVRRNRNETPGNSGNFTCAMEAASLDPGMGCQATNRRTFDYTSYTASLDWQATQDLFFYVKTSRGYRSGGFNTRAVTGGSSVTFDPEKLTDYEIGGKLDLLDRRLRLNVAAFYSDYKNVQRNVPVVVPGSATLTSGNQNAATAVIKGLEAELTVRPIEHLTLGGSLTLLDPRYKRFTIPTSPTTSLDVSATPFIYTPKTSYTISGDYVVPTGAGDLTFHADYAHRSASYAVGPLVGQGLFGAANPDTARIPAYGILNGQISFALENPRIEIAVYGRNVLDKKYYQRLLALEDTPLGVTSYLPGDPRTYGASATYRF